MRLATAADEILPMRDPRVQQNPSYLSVIILSRVVTKMGGLNSGSINTGVIENLFSVDFAHLQEMYNRINQSGKNAVGAECPQCGHRFDVDLLKAELEEEPGGD